MQQEFQKFRITKLSPKIFWLYNADFAMNKSTITRIAFLCYAFAFKGNGV